MKEVKQVSFFMWRGRHKSEKAAPMWSGAVDTWLEMEDGTARLLVEGVAQPPAVLEAQGFRYEDFMSAIAAGALREKEQAELKAAKAEEAKQKAQEALDAVKAQMRDAPAAEPPTEASPKNPALAAVTFGLFGN